MSDISTIDCGTVYFFYRPKIDQEQAANLSEVQRFFLIFKPDKSSNYIELIVGKKKMPVQQQETFFCYVENVYEDQSQVVDALGDSNYQTVTQGSRHESTVRCVGQGRYALIGHDGHTHFCYDLSRPKVCGDVQKAFALEQSGDFLITVKNPKFKENVTLGLDDDQKAQYPDDLQKLFGDNHFHPLSTVDFLFNIGAEILLIGKHSSDLETPQIKPCLKTLQKDDLVKVLSKENDETVTLPLNEKIWA